MNKKIYTSTTLEKCLELASNELDIAVENIQYNILEQNKLLFRKSCTIEVANDFEMQDQKQQISEDLKIKDGSVYVKDGVLIVKNPKDDGMPAEIIPGDKIVFIVDGTEITSKVQVFEHNAIEVRFPEETAKRNLNISISRDNMKAFMDISYEPQNEYKLQDSPETKDLVLKTEISNETYPPIYTVEELRNELKKANINCGIIEENLKKCTKEKNIRSILIAEGKSAIDDEPDEIDVKFAIYNKSRLKEDYNGRVDYKNIGAVEAVTKGELLAVKIDGKTGEDGINVKGEAIKHKAAKRITFRAGNGCELVEGNKIIASIDGKPCVKNGVFYVNQVYEINSDVNLKTGNVDFAGDISIHGAVTEGMKVKAGNTVIIDKNVESAEIIGKGDIIIKGNVILSKIYGGGNDVIKLQYLNDLNAMNKSLKELMDTVMEIKKFNLLGRDAGDGEVIKALIENKFKNIPKICASIIRDSILENDDNEELINMIKEKLIGLAPLNIKHFGEIDDIISLVERKSEALKLSLSLPVNVSISYCQDSNINSSGSIYITGKGEYVSNITANDSVFFDGEGSVARGGVIKAKNDIKCKTVGSTGGVSTKLMVESKGHIWADVAYQNTIFVVGDREETIDVPCRNVHAYMDDKGEITVDTLKL